MILNTKEFQSACKKILFAIDNKNASLITETLELSSDGSELLLNVTNREYYVSVKFNLVDPEAFRASVNASLFLSLISKVTTDTIEIKKNNNDLTIKANGTYKLPIIFNNDSMLELPKIEINNVTNTMSISGAVLNSIANYNSKELQRGIPVKPVQKYYYMDNEGAITFTQGACVNSFSLEKPVKVLLSDKVVKLFKLFNNDSNVHFTMGQDSVMDDTIQTKVRFETDSIKLTAKLSDSSLISSVPVKAIRDAATKTYNYSVVVCREDMLNALNRILLFSEQDTLGLFEFDSTSVSISNITKDSIESVTYKNMCDGLTSYSMRVNLSKFKIILEGCEDEYITINFGDKRQVVVKKVNVCDITPEL